jgi:gingipain R
MKKFTLFFVIITCFFVSSFAAKGYEVKFSQANANEYQLSFTLTEWNMQHVQFDGVDFQQIIFSSSAVTKKTGWAELPFISASVQLPAQKNVDLSVIYSNYTDYQLNFPLVPSRGVINRSQDLSTIPYRIDPASIVNIFYPNELAVAEEPFIIRDVRGTSVRVFPFRYNAATNTLRVYNKVDVLLTENDEPATNPLLTENINPIREMRGIYQSLFINYSTPKLPLTMAEYGDILVITTSRDETAIQPYIDWKKEKGYNVDKEVVANTLTSTQIKSLIQNKYNANHNLMYVLLVGGWSEIKSDMIYSVVGLGSGPTDPMLGDVAGNANDYRPDISIGRMSANSAAQVTVQVNKAIQYEKTPNMDPAWYSSFIGVASNDSQGLTWGDDGEMDYTHIQRIYSQRLEPVFNYNQHYRLYQNESGCTSTNLRNYINSGASTIAYCGHGSSTVWSTTGFNNTNINQLTNGDKLPFIVASACDNGKFHNASDCFAEVWLKKENGGAVVTWMSTMLHPWDPPMRGQDYFYDILIGGFDYNLYPTQNGINTNEQRTHWGAITVNVANLMLTEVNNTEDKECVRTWTTFGDPSLQLRTKLPAVILSSHNTMTVGVPYTTTITTNGAPVKDALVCISQNNTYRSAFTDNNGTVTIANPFAEGNVRLVVTAFNTTTIYEMIECVEGSQPQLCEPPVNISANANGYTATISWNPPANVDGVLLGYNVYRNGGIIGETSATQYNDPSLAVGTYIYKVSAKYAHCPESELSAGATVEIVYIPVLCEKPINLLGMDEEYDAVITWAQPSNIDGVLLGYKVYRDGNLIGQTTSSITAYRDEELAPGIYVYKVSAKYEHCESPLTDGVTVEIHYIPVLCEKPENLSGVAEGYNAVITWQQPANIDGVLLGYNVYRDGDLIGETTSSITAYRDEELAPGIYVYKVSAKYEHCEESPLTDGITVEILYIPVFCEKPGNPSVRPDENDYQVAIITWDRPENIDGILLGYNIYLNGDKRNEDLITEQEYRDTVQLVGNGTVYYKLSAVYEHCESELTEDIRFEVNDIPNYIETLYNIYPNPTTGKITIEGNGVIHIEIYDVQGRKLVEHDNISEIISINVSNYDNGIYFVKLFTQTGVVVTKRLVIIK